MIQIGGVYTTLCQKEGILLQKYRDRHGRRIAILFKVSGSGVDLILLNFGGETFVESAGDITLRGLRGAKHFSDTFRIGFRFFLFAFFNPCSHRFNCFGCNFVLQTCHPNKIAACGPHFSVAPIFFSKESSALEQGVCFFPKSPKP